MEFLDQMFDQLSKDLNKAQQTIKQFKDVLIDNWICGKEDFD